MRCGGHFFCSAAILLTASQSHAAPSDFDKKSLVYIECAAPGGSPIKKGSGVIVTREGHVLTAKHVAPDGYACNGSRGSIRTTPPTRVLSRSGTSALDAMILKFVPEPGEVFVPVNYVRLNEDLQTQSVGAWGFHPQLTTNQVSYFSGVISTTLPDEKGMIQTDALTTRGMSGGPTVLSANSGLVGIISGANFDRATGTPDYYGVLAAQTIAHEFGLTPIGGAGVVIAGTESGPALAAAHADGVGQDGGATPASLEAAGPRAMTESERALLQSVATEAEAAIAIYSDIGTALAALYYNGIQLRADAPRTIEEAQAHLDRYVTEPNLRNRFDAFANALSLLSDKLTALDRAPFAKSCFAGEGLFSGAIVEIARGFRRHGFTVRESLVDIRNITDLVRVLNVAEWEIRNHRYLSLISAAVQTDLLNQHSVGDALVRNLFFTGNLIFGILDESQTSPGVYIQGSYGAGLLRDFARAIPDGAAIKQCLARRERGQDFERIADRFEIEFRPTEIIDNLLLTAIERADAIGGLYFLEWRPDPALAERLTAAAAKPPAGVRGARAVFERAAARAEALARHVAAEEH